MEGYMYLKGNKVNKCNESYYASQLKTHELYE